MIRTFFRSHVFIFILAFLGAFLFPTPSSALAAYSTLFLQIIFFISSLKINIRDFVKEGKNVQLLILVNAWMLLVLPAVVYVLSRFFVPEYVVAFTLLAAMPAGMTSPLLTEVIGGRQSLALWITISTSLLAPFTIPLVMKFSAGSQVSVDFFTMFISLLKTIFIPFFLAQAVRFVFPNFVLPKYFRTFSVILLGLLIAGVLGKNANIFSSLHITSLFMPLSLLCFLFLFFHITGYAIALREQVSDRVTTMLCLSYLNFTLAIYLAGEFFNDPKVVLPTVLSVIPWSFAMIPFSYIAPKILKNKKDYDPEIQHRSLAK